MKLRLLGAVCAFVASLPVNVSAVVVNTLNGVDYEWLELTVTDGMSRDQVELQIAAATPGDTFYGYEFASRALIEDLFLSYSTWGYPSLSEGLSGWHSTTPQVQGQVSLINDFGITSTSTYGSSSQTDVTGNSIPYDAGFRAMGFYGAQNECGGSTSSCFANNTVLTYQGANQLASMFEDQGYDSTFVSPHTYSNSTAFGGVGSYLVRETVVSTVPVPAAFWLFGSGLLGLIGVARSKVRA